MKEVSPAAQLPNEFKDEHQHQVQPPVPETEVEAEVLFDIGEIEFRKSSHHVVVGLSNYVLSSSKKDHEVGHMVAATLDRLVCHFYQSASRRRNGASLRVIEGTREVGLRIGSIDNGLHLLTRHYVIWVDWKFKNNMFL